MIGFKLDSNKALTALLYVSKVLGTNADFHKTYKILYFADQLHLLKYGRPVVGDTYVKMNYGPVPSFIKNIVDGNIDSLTNNVAVYNKKYIKPIVEPNLDFLSESDLECINESIQSNKDLSFDQLTKKSHDFAWHNASWQMDYEDILKAVSSDENMLKYVQNNMMNNNLKLK